MRGHFCFSINNIAWKHTNKTEKLISDVSKPFVSPVYRFGRPKKVFWLFIWRFFLNIHGEECFVIQFK